MTRTGETERDATDDVDAEAKWALAPMYLFGYFGGNTPAAVRLRGETAIALAVFVIASAGVSGLFGAVPAAWLWALAVPGSVCGLWWANARYIRTLDELSRMIHLQAFAVAYAVTMVICFAIVGFGSLGGLESRMHPALVGVLAAFAEPIRGAALAHFARKYG